MSQPRPLVLTMGEPAGIGAEIAFGAWRALRHTGPAFVLIDDADRLTEDAVRVVAAPAAAGAAFADAMPVLHSPLPVRPVPGRPEIANAAAVIGAIARAVALTRAGETSAVVTNPIQKAVLTAAGFPHPGHTEFLGELAGGEAVPVMLLACPGLRTVPVTVHQSLASAIAALDTARIVAVGRRVHAALVADFGIAAPRLAVAGLNPHAGEDGTLGMEDRDIVAPAIVALRDAGIDARGPYPADTMFTPHARSGYDVALCMYHDQALIPVKTLDMAGGVNVTLGLPFIRTSPDHGTALDIAGTGRADPSSLIAALLLAAELARHRSAR